MRTVVLQCNWQFIGERDFCPEPSLKRGVAMAVCAVDVALSWHGRGGEVNCLLLGIVGLGTGRIEGSK